MKNWSTMKSIEVIPQEIPATLSSSTRESGKEERTNIGPTGSPFVLWTNAHSFFFFFFFWSFRVKPSAYGSSQARGGILAMSATYTTDQILNTHWARPRIKLASSWIVVRFITTEQQRELSNACFHQQESASFLILISDMPRQGRPWEHLPCLQDYFITDIVWHCQYI